MAIASHEVLHNPKRLREPDEADWGNSRQNRDGDGGDHHQQFGMTESAYFIGRYDILAWMWINATLQLGVFKVEEVAIYCCRRSLQREGQRNSGAT
ncbi:unnamed protein product [Urochloa humidicola]